MARADRVDWVDYAKGFCIIMVVMMHSTLGVEKAVGEEGWMGAVVAFAKPFRMPDFFLISGLFLARVIDRDWRLYLDRKVVHFAYFYVLWLTIQFAFKAPGIAAEAGPAGAVEAYLLAFIEPFGTLWFIYLLPVFFVVTKALRRAPWPLVLAAAAILEMLPVQTGWTLIDEFCSRFVYFYLGYAFAALVFQAAAGAIARKPAAWAYLAGWALLNGVLVFAGLSELPGVGLTLGVLGAGAVVTFSALLSTADLMTPLRYLGRHSIVIYLAFFLPMAATRSALLIAGVVPDVGMMSLIVTAAAVVSPLVLYWAVRRTPGRFLFERPDWARLGAGRARLAPAE